uniref:Uncharacterized protein n=1 Tax=Romanomermis culicivorax TaxID=13658 RepID=A0A915J918_ROMCU
IETKKIDETRKIVIRKIKAAKLPKKIVRSKNYKLKIKLQQKVVGNVVEKLRKTGSEDEFHSETNKHKEKSVVDAVESPNIAQESSVSENPSGESGLSTSSLNLETDAVLTSMES